uniref:Uncharacterized protein n=1 Tax=Oncorhynchus mykiss TaxID=8022 RepID=A0A8C7S9X6_ONCMY
MYSFDGVLVFGLLFICTCASHEGLAEKRGVWGMIVFVLVSTASVIGTRLHLTVALSCVTMAFYVFLKGPTRGLDCLVGTSWTLAWSQVSLTMTAIEFSRQ